MAYNKDAHRADITQQTINDLRQSIDDLKLLIRMIIKEFIRVESLPNILRKK